MPLTTVIQRLSIHDVDPAATTQAVPGLERYIRASDLDRPPYELIKSVPPTSTAGAAVCD